MINGLNSTLFTYLFLAVGLSSMTLVAMEDQFNHSMRKIKQKCNLHSLRKGIQELDSCLISEMVDNRDIKRYLQRPLEKTPISIKNEPIITNKYEEELYNTLGKTGASYRSYIKKNGNGRFYTAGTPRADRFLRRSAKKHIGQLDKNVILKSNGHDIYSLSDVVHCNAEKIRNNEHHVSMHDKDDHAFASVVKYSPEHNPITFLLNSTKSNDYHSYLEYRFNLDKTGEKRLPFVDASFDLQHENSYPEDSNCSLYAFEFAKASAAYLHNNNTGDLHKACVAGNHTSAAQILRNGMKRYLPYYTCSAEGTCTEKSQADIQKFHIELRWLISGKVIWKTLKSIALTARLKRSTEQQHTMPEPSKSNLNNDKKVSTNSIIR